MFLTRMLGDGGQMGRSYEIRLFDQTLVAFTIADDGFGPVVTFDDYDDGAVGLMPCGLALSGEGIWRWLELRSIPTNRKFAAEICRELGFVLGDLEATYRASLGLSLNDAYWVVPAGFVGRFDDYNLYENGFSDALGGLAISGDRLGSPYSGNTPELTTDGTLRKAWRIVQGSRMLYKGASDGYEPGEPLSEYLASLIAQDLGLHAVRYGLDTWQGELCSICDNFTTKAVSYVPFAVATGLTDLAGALWWCARLGRESLERTCDMLTFDALVCNTDRHLTNFGVLRDNRTGGPVGMAPIFDNGRSLFPNVSESDSRQFGLEAELHAPVFGGLSFSELASRVKGPRQQAMLEAVAERGIIGNVHAPGDRVAALDAFVRNQAEMLLALPVVDHDDLVESLDRAMSRRSRQDKGVIRLSPFDNEGPCA